MAVAAVATEAAAAAAAVAAEAAAAREELPVAPDERSPEQLAVAGGVLFGTALLGRRVLRGIAQVQ